VPQRRITWCDEKANPSQSASDGYALAQPVGEGISPHQISPANHIQNQINYQNPNL